MVTMVRDAASSPTLFLFSGWTGLRKTTISISFCKGGDGTPKLELLHTQYQRIDILLMLLFRKFRTNQNQSDRACHRLLALRRQPRHLRGERRRSTTARGDVTTRVVERINIT
uniref:Uncharacterized protein n=1 Tax=Caenorhabditis japonica TaxID=281687 RepID=A0A8R1DG04_CAEJA